MVFRSAIAAVAFAALVMPASLSAQPKEAEPATRDANVALLGALPFTDRADFEDAQRGFIATLPDGLIADGARTIWSMKPYDFLRGDAPPTVNPSLWRQAQLNNVHGLFQVTERVYQIRGFDISNMTIMEGETGVVIVDPLLSAETARAGIELYYRERGRKPVVAVIYSHSHADHFGGVKGVTSEEDVRAGKTRVFAPDGFMAHAVAENIIAGNAMSRRARYQFGTTLPPGERAQVDTGLGRTLSRGTLTLIAPTDLIKQSFETRTIDGLEIEFHLVPASEAPSEMIMYLPQLKLLNMAEDVTHNMHNLYTIRGAEVRDASLWAGYINEALERYGARTEALIAQHHWPIWGSARIAGFMKRQRDMYKFIHDQSVRLLNHGYLPAEIAETLKMPASLAADWATHGYYGTLSHNAKAIYQKYLGWYDGNPANLSPLPAVESARRTVEYMGGAEAVIKRARADFAAGQFRWVASIMREVVFAEPANREARELGADALEQLGYQAEAGTWRNAYLTGAQELRGGQTKLPNVSTLTPDLLQALDLDLLFDFIAVRLNADKADGKTIVINWTFTDVKQQIALNLENSTLTHITGKRAEKADAGFTLARATLDQILLRQKTFPAAIQAGEIKAEGDPRKLGELLGMLDEFTPDFPIMEPKQARQ